MKQGAIIILLFLLAGIAVVPARADDEKEKKHYLYQWKDEKGNVYIVDELGKVPEQFRSKAQRLESPQSDNGEEGGVPRERYTPTVPSPSPVVNEEAEKARWRQKLRMWKDKLTRAEERQKQLKEERFLQYAKWGSPALAPIRNRERIVAIDKELQEIQKKIDEANKMIDVVIPEEARKAGVPPGWLRE